MRHSRHQFVQTPHEPSSAGIRFSVQVAEMVLIAGAVWISYVVVAPWLHT